MARTPRFKVAAIAELLRQLRYAPTTTRMRQMDAAEQLVSELDPSRNYPESFITYRITSYRPDHETSTLFVGEALVPDLINFVLHISRDMTLPPDHAGRSAMSIEQVTDRLSITERTLQRYRKQGLVCHYVHFPDGQRLACFEDALKRFCDSHQKRLTHAAGFNRLGKDTEDEIINRARKLHESQQLTLNQAAKHLAQHYERAHETIRQLLRRHDAKSSQPIFTAPGPLDERASMLTYRAWRLGISVKTIATRLNKTTTTIHRAINRQRAARLLALDLSHITLPTFALDDAQAIILSHTAVNSMLDDVLPHDDALQLLHAACETSIDEDSEQAMLAGYHFLKHRAAHAIAQLEPWPGAAVLDRIETQLRWAGHIKRRLVCVALHAGIRSVEQHLRRPLRDQPSEVVLSSIALSVSVLAEVIDRLDPSRGTRLARLASQDVDRALSKQDNVRQLTRAAAKHSEQGIALDNPFANIYPWTFLDERPIPASIWNKLDPLRQQLLSLRRGHDGAPPQTFAAIAKTLKRTDASIARLIASAERQVRLLMQQQG